MSEHCMIDREDCRYRGTDECMFTTHHIWFPAMLYATKIEKQFRELSCNKVRLPRCEHEDLHATQPAPSKPPRGFMLSEIERMGE